MRHHSPLRVIAPIAGVATLLLEACGAEADVAGPPRVTVVDVTPPIDTLIAVGQTLQLSASVKDARGTAVRGVTIIWISTDEAVATVNDTGLVTAAGNGEARIIATASGVSGRAHIVVSQRIAKLVVVGEPSDVIAGEVVTPPITVDLRDAGGSRVTDAAVPVTLTLGANPGDATLAGTLTVTSTGGVATFGDVWLNKAGHGYTLSATVPELDAATSHTFAVAPGPGLLSFLPQPGTAEGQVPFDPVVQVAAREDRFGNVVPDALVTVALAVSPTGESLSGTTTVAAVQGVAPFGDLTLAIPGQGFVLEASSGAATPVRSAAFNVRLTFAQVSVGKSHSCAVTTAEFAYCWGLNGNGQVGSGDPDQQHETPTPVAGDLTFVEVSAGASHTCGVTSDNAAYCWGSSMDGQLGDGTTFTGARTPRLVSGDLSFARVSAGADHTCGVTTVNVAYCWGLNRDGRLGDGTTESRATPTPVTGGLGFASLSAGGSHTCGVTTDNAAYCWGENFGGQLGDGTRTTSLMPVLVVGDVPIRQVTAGFVHTCAITATAAGCAGSSGRCAGRYTTFERVEGIGLQVVKRSGERVPFDRERIIAGITKACVNRPVDPATVELDSDACHQARAEADKLGIGAWRSVRALTIVRFDTDRKATTWKRFRSWTA